MRGLGCAGEPLPWHGGFERRAHEPKGRAHLGRGTDADAVAGARAPPGQRQIKVERLNSWAALQGWLPAGKGRAGKACACCGRPMLNACLCLCLSAMPSVDVMLL